MSLYKQWGVTHYIFDIIVLTSSEKSFSRLHHRIFLHIIHVFLETPNDAQNVQFESGQKWVGGKPSIDEDGDEQCLRRKKKKEQKSVMQIGNRTLDFSNRSFVKLFKFIYILGRKKFKYEMGNLQSKVAITISKNQKSDYHLLLEQMPSLLLGREVESVGYIYVITVLPLSYVLFEEEQEKKLEFIKN